MSSNKTRPERTDAELHYNTEKARFSRRNSVQTHIEYGEIAEIDYNNCKVKVKRLKNNRLIQIDKKNFNWLLTPITEIHMKYGPLVPGMPCLIHWEGSQDSEPGLNVAIQILGNKEDRLDKQTYGTNNISIGFNAGKLA
jgi:hypothetical protein